MQRYTINGVSFSVDFTINRVFCHKYNNNNLIAHVYGIHDDQPGLDALHQYPGLACSIKLPKINAKTEVCFVCFDSHKRLRLVKARLDTKLYFAHHHYGKYYVYGQVPAVVEFDVARAADLFVGAPVFDAVRRRLVSFVTNCHFSDNASERQKQLIVPVTGESYRLQGMFCINGGVRLYGENEVVDAGVRSDININVKYTKKQVDVFVVYNGEIISRVTVKSKFTGNVLIV
ncbi:p26-b [Orgyia leucostigma nucleopolyhedrovirus]|uniref:p26-b n=1 Tax=Orgyia leucostigma nucleopolyhedrovirus TaxID=490711 RepID=B0FDT0_9ABAC|nr:p26-b [Orgyia leucostigma nucleopolyhedrovirus]ABY65788.1 p26-b [Orgyia leucostigma nucleopolyhedrovirus]